jgi:hypothetical protein
MFTGLSHSTLSAQNNLESRLRDMLKQGLPESYIQGYMQPFSTAFGTIAAGGVYHRATAKEFPHLDFGINVVSLEIPDRAGTFVYEGVTIPTFFGTRASAGEYPGGIDLNRITVPQVQLNLGLFSGFEMMLRGNKYSISEIGEVDFLGVAIKYGLSDILPVPESPIGMSVQVLYHTYGISNWFNSGTFAMNLQSSLDLLVIPVNIYGGLGYESSSLKISTDKIPAIGEDGIGDISINGKNKLRLTIGAGLNLYFMNIHADYNFGEFHSFAAGAMIVF